MNINSLNVINVYSLIKIEHLASGVITGFDLLFLRYKFCTCNMGSLWMMQAISNNEANFKILMWLFHFTHANVFAISCIFSITLSSGRKKNAQRTWNKWKQKFRVPSIIIIFFIFSLISFLVIFTFLLLHSHSTYRRVDSLQELQNKMGNHFIQMTIAVVQFDIIIPRHHSQSPHWIPFCSVYDKDVQTVF